MQPLIHLGYHKTATTWFQNHLWGNNDFGFAKGLIGHEEQILFRVPAPFEFDGDATSQHLQKLFVDRVPKGCTPTLSCETFSGSFLAGGHDAKQNADRLKEALPNAKIFVCVREQKSAVLSAWRQYIREGGQCSLRRFLRPLYVLSVTFPQFRLEHFAYDRLVAYYQKLFGRENVHVGFFEEFKSEPVVFLVKLLEFVHGSGHAFRDIDKLPLNQPANVMLSRLSLGLKRRFNLIASGRHGVAQWTMAEPQYVGHRLATSLLNPACKIVSRLTPKFLDRWLTDRDRRHVAEFIDDYFLESNQRLAELTGEDPERWGYAMGDAPQKNEMRTGRAA